MDLVTRKWLATVVSAEETSTQIEVVFTDALEAEGLLDEAAERGSDGLIDPTVDDERRPILLAVSDNGPQMTSGSTREFMVMCAIAQHFGRPGTPTDQGWIETLFGHIKGEWPHLDQIDDPAVLRAELEVVRTHYNTVRLHEGIGYVTPEDEHEGRGPTIRQARRDGLKRARAERITYHRKHNPPEPHNADYYPAICVFEQTHLTRWIVLGAAVGFGALETLLPTRTVIDARVSG
jgi:putative transposase